MFGFIKKKKSNRQSVNKLSEKDRIALEAGELIHGIGNLVCDGNLQAPWLDLESGSALRDIGHALRRKPSYSTQPMYVVAGHNISTLEHEALVDIASRFMGNAGMVPIEDLIAYHIDKSA
ncbi:hypothetical protein K0504_09955 [Neiella marina]|uniref:Uncharacterized protein n=1 Tax=Neiella holothuriorum TaxID=2870530 RepID=A0ABS7EG84_9GAMM|nr:hypothetical protein [Neiella holothuriorum]MBW8191361.1 hypothetical protein [Neiella holothuriorum]